MNTDNPVLAAIIAATSAVIVGFINLLSSKKDTAIPSQKEIYSSALNTVWEPLDKLFTLHSATSPQDKLHQIDTIISDNYKLVPTEFMKEYASLKQLHKINESDFTRIQMISSSYFNWMRKYLGYPYNEKKIKVEFTPKTRRDILLSSLGYIALLLITIIVGLMVLFSIMMLYANDRLSVVDYLALAAALLGIVVTWHLTLNQPRK